MKRVLVAGLGALAVCAAGCATSAPASTRPDGTISVVAGEDFWGSIAKQLGGDHITETSVIGNPDVDPHSYEPTAADGRAIAGARMVIGNGIGYDPWLSKFLAANPSGGRRTLIVGSLLGLADDANPHRWYDRSDVYRVADQITADYRTLDPKHAADYDRLRAAFETTALAAYDQLISDIRRTYAGTPIGASESIVSPLADALGLNLITPASFLRAISEGSDVSAADKSTIDRQITTHQIKVYVYNSQNATPDVAAQVKAAKAAGIPVATVTETLTPAGTSFQDWQVTELRGIKSALAQATGK